MGITYGTSTFFQATKGIVQDGLVLNLDAGVNKSYPRNGTTWDDLAGSNSGTLINGPTFDRDNGGSIVFDGTNDYVNTPVNIDANPSSIGAWFNPSATNGARGVVLTDNGGWDKGFEVNNGWWGIHVGNTLTTIYTAVSADTWYYGFLIYTASSMSFYVNGVNIWNGGTPGSSSGSTVEIGRANYSSGNGSRFFVGNISLVHIYNRALTATEVLQNYNATKARFGL